MNDMEKTVKTENEKEGKKEKLDALYKKYKDRFHLRPLRDDDMYTIIHLVEALLPEEGVRDAFAAVALGNLSFAQVGARVMVDMILSVMKNAGAVKDDLYAFLSDLSGITPEKIREMPFGTTPAMLWALVNDAKNADFFEDVSMLF
ncbi:MAG: hypothetical protein IKY41_06140 [Clostridia bacterium]|nr:hypothetical protein [Clostridia bacterium]